jgi:hypothetical protein
VEFFKAHAQVVRNFRRKFSMEIITTNKTLKLSLVIFNYYILKYDFFRARYGGE